MLKFFLILMVLNTSIKAKDINDNFNIMYIKNNLKESINKTLPFIRSIAQNPIVIKAVKSHNERKQSLDAIHMLDKNWIESNQNDLKKEIISKKRSSFFLKSKVLNNPKKMFSEIFLTDKAGALVATYPLTTDYWQGDEEKWIKAYNDGDCQIAITALGYDKSSDRIVSQVSMPVLDEVGECIGILIASVRYIYLDKLEKR